MMAGGCSVAGSQVIKQTTTSDSNIGPLYLDTSIVSQLANNTTGMYAIASTSGAGKAMHLLLKLPRLRTQKGFFLATVIVYMGLTALTTVWQFTNKTNAKIVDLGIGPHIVVFVGVGYSTFKRNYKGGFGSMIGVTILKPKIFP